MSHLEANVVKIGTYFDLDSVRYANANIFNAINKKGYQDIVLDFEICESINAGAMAALCSQVSKLKKNRVDFSLTLPAKEKLRRLFNNANWAHFIEERRFVKADITPNSSHVPLVHYLDSSQQQKVVNQIIESMLSTVVGISRSNLKAVEWALNEVTDNVLNHSDSIDGGFVQLSYKKILTRQSVEIVVCDAGIGIPKSLRATFSEIKDDAEALEKSVQEGITRNKITNQGNGLYGSFEISRVSKGKFSLIAGNATLKLDKGAVSFKDERIPYDGTIVYAVIDISDPNILEKALKFGGRVYSPLDSIDYKYDYDDNQFIEFSMSDHSKTFGSRSAAKPIHTKIKNLLDLVQDKNILIDFDGVTVISSSFADEVFGRLFLEYGPRMFNSRIKFKNTNSTIDGLIDRAIIQRVKVG